MLPLEARSAHCPPPVADGMSLPRSNRAELHTTFTQSSIVPISRPLVELFAPDGANPCGEDGGDEHPANMAMATTAANPSILFICTAPAVRWARANPIYAALRFNPNDETLATLTTTRYPNPQLVTP